MKVILFYLTLTALCISCNNVTDNNNKKTITKSISIFEIYVEDSIKLDRFTTLLRDTLKLPVEWEPFDFFGNGVVKDAAFYIRNTTLELLSVNPPDTTIRVPARYNRILFESKNIDSTYHRLTKKGVKNLSAFNFNIVSNNSELMIGRQINLNTLSSSSNINIAFWEYINDGYSFEERTIKGNTIDELRPKLNKALLTNPMGIVELKEVHLTLTQKVINEWNNLIGTNNSNRWILEKGPIISFTSATNNIGADWITIKVKNIKVAKNYLALHNLLATKNDKILIEPSKIYGLKIYFEE